MFVIRRQLKADEGAPPNVRVNPDTGETEITTDGGATWTPNPESDPRQNTGYQQPPVTGFNARCAAAAGMVENVRKVVEAGVVGGTTGWVATILLTLLLIPGVGWMFSAILLFATSLITALSLGLASELTEEVYDRLLCIFFEGINSDGTVTWEQLEIIHSQVAAEYPGTLIPDFIGGLFQYQKEVGVTNAGIAYADPEADCSECTSICRQWLGSFGLGDMLPVEGSTYDAVNDWVLWADFGGASYASAIVPVTPGVEYTIAINGTWAGQATMGDCQLYWIQGTDFGSLIGVATIPGMADGDNTPFWHSTDVPATYDGLYITLQAVGGSATVILKGVELCEA